MPTGLSSNLYSSGGTITRCFFNCTSVHSLGDGYFSNPGLDHIGNAGINTYRGPSLITDDAGLAKTFTVWEQVAVKFRMDAFNVFNHINAGNPGGNIESKGSIGGEAPGCSSGAGTCGPRQMEFSLRVQF